MPHSTCTKFAEHLLRFRSHTCQSLQRVTAQDIFWAVLSELTTDLRTKLCLVMKPLCIYEGWNFNSGNYLFTTDTK